MYDAPVTLDHVKTHLRLGSTDREDDYLNILISAAGRAIENATGRDITAEPLTERDLLVVSQATLLLVGQWYANREASVTNLSEMPMAVGWLIAPLRRFVV